MDEEKALKAEALIKSVRSKVRFYNRFRVKRDKIFAEQRAKQAKLDEQTK